MLGLYLDFMIFQVFSNLNDSTILLHVKVSHDMISTYIAPLICQNCLMLPIKLLLSQIFLDSISAWERDLTSFTYVDTELELPDKISSLQVK